MRTRDPVERLAVLAVGQKVHELRQRNRDIERQNLANEIGGSVGKIVSSAMSQLQNNLMRAMRG